MKVDFKILKDDGDKYVLSFEKLVDGTFGEELGDVILKLYVQRDDLEHIKNVIERKLKE